MIYNCFQGWVDAATVDIAESSNELLDIVARQQKSNAAGRPRFVTGKQPWRWGQAPREEESKTISTSCRWSTWCWCF
jgi:hypothetical protein